MEVFAHCSEESIQVLEAAVVQALDLLRGTAAGHAYHEACATAPQTVQAGPALRDFLRVEEWHVLKAAQRIAKYWTVRRQVYGTARWLRPLSQTGDGVLDADQVALLRTGFLAPASVVTSHNQRHSTVLISDSSRLPPGVCRQQPGILFYVGSLSGKDKDLQLDASSTNNITNNHNHNNHNHPLVDNDDGVTLFHVIQPGNLPVLPNRSPLLQQILQCLPNKIKQVVITKTFQPTANAQQGQLLDAMAAQQRQRSQVNHTDAQVWWVQGHSLRQVLDQLEILGIEPSCIPLAMGGSYNHEQHFYDWVRRRLSRETMQQLPTTTSLLLTAGGDGGDGTNVVSSCPQQYPTMPGHVRTDVAVRHALPYQNEAITSRQPKPPSTSSSSTTTSSPTPQALVKQMPGESRQAFERRRSLVYGQRSYHKKRRETAALGERCDQLRAANQALQADNRRLEDWLGRARFLVAVETGALLAPVDPSLF